MTDLNVCATHGTRFHSKCHLCVGQKLADEQAAAPPEKRYPLASNGVFWTLQGEGHLRGFQMGFIRLGGCSVGCTQCDTDYAIAERLTAAEIVARCFQVFPHGDRDQWVWITGGEPTDHDLRPLLRELAGAGYRIALATSGVRPHIPPVDWLSVSPHSVDPARFRQRYGNEVKLVDGLHGLSIDEWVAAWDATDFMYRYVQPMSRVRREESHDGPPFSVYEEDPASLARCLAFLKRHPRWALSRQDHHHWGVA